MYKYQKYVANLKIEFKNKIESLYRNIKKNQWKADIWMSEFSSICIYYKIL